jgi:hypothetical protein
VSRHVHDNCFAEIARLRELNIALEKVAAETHPCSPLHIIELEQRLFPDIPVVAAGMSAEAKREAQLIAELDQTRAENEALRHDLTEAGADVV